MTKCSACGKSIKKSYSGYCQGCYNYFVRDGGTIHPIPQKGRIEYDPDGKIICHICGRSYTRLGSHVRESHSMTIDTYKDFFGLCRTAKTTEARYSNLMRQLALSNEMDKRLVEIGKNTRIKPGESRRMRKGRKTRLQERLDKSERMKGKTK